MNKGYLHAHFYRQNREKNIDVKREVRRLKERNLEQRVEQMERDLRQNNSHNLFIMIEELGGKSMHPLETMRDQDGNIVSDATEVMAIWREHF